MLSKLKSADNVYDREERLTTSHVKKPYTYVLTERFVSSLTTQSIFASHSVCTTVAEFIAKRNSVKFVDEVGSTVFYKNIIVRLQPIERSLKQTLRTTSPSSTVG